MVNMILDKLPLRLRDCPLNCKELLREIDARSIIGKHPYHLVKMPFGSLEALHDARMRLVNGRFHDGASYSSKRTVTTIAANGSKESCDVQ
jgi:hypothetical protein